MSREERTVMMRELAMLWKSSGMSQDVYATRHRISIYTLRYWLRKIRISGSDKGSVGVSGGFIQLHGHGRVPGMGIRIRYPNGVEVVLPDGTPVGMVKTLVDF